MYYKVNCYLMANLCQASVIVLLRVEQAYRWTAAKLVSDAPCSAPLTIRGGLVSGNGRQEVFLGRGNGQKLDGAPNLDIVADAA